MKDRSLLSLAVGAVLILSSLGFFAFYAHELDPGHPWPPPFYGAIEARMGGSGILWINLLFVAGILCSLGFRRSARPQWATKGVFAAFMVSLLTEMFGVPIVAYLLSPWVSMPLIGLDYLEAFGHGPVTAGMAIAFLGLALILASWTSLHRGRGGLVTSGPYALMRHPQYLGFLLFTLGWLLHWPTIASLVLWPAVVVAFLHAARVEEREAAEAYGAAYEAYRRQTPFIFPGRRSRPPRKEPAA